MSEKAKNLLLLQAISQSFRLYFRHFKIYFPLGLLSALPGVDRLLGVDSQASLDTAGWPLIVGLILVLIVCSFFFGLTVLVSLELVKNSEVKWKESFTTGLDAAPIFLITLINYGLIVSLGLLAFVLPGVYLLAAFSLTFPILLSEGWTSPNPFFKSNQLLRGVRLRLSVFYLFFVFSTVGLTVAAGGVPNGFGILVECFVSIFMIPIGSAILPTVIYSKVK